MAIAALYYTTDAQNQTTYYLHMDGWLRPLSATAFGKLYAGTPSPDIANQFNSASPPFPIGTPILDDVQLVYQSADPNTLYITDRQAWDTSQFNQGKYELRKLIEGQEAFMQFDLTKKTEWTGSTSFSVPISIFSNKYQQALQLLAGRYACYAYIVQDLEPMNPFFNYMLAEYPPPYNPRTRPGFKSEIKPQIIEAQAAVNAFPVHVANFTTDNTSYLSGKGPAPNYMSTWVELESLDASPVDYFVMGAYDFDNDKRSWLLRYNCQNKGFELVLSSNGTATTKIMAPAAQTRVWYFVEAWVNRDGKMGIMLNRDPSTLREQTGVVPFNATNIPLTVGGGYSEKHLDGCIGPTSMADAMPSDDCRDLLYNGGLPQDFGDLPYEVRWSIDHYWNMDEASGQRMDSFGFMGSPIDLTVNGTVGRTGF